ncbi:hypothetical protein HDU96_000959 [Phlyctochytrium bullatum]|nr:hypothetical protein HDU96_000959 [Phlyctochytrium bullatum]
MSSSSAPDAQQVPGAIPATSRLRIKFWGLTTTLTLSDPVPVAPASSDAPLEFRTQLWLSTPGNDSGFLASGVPITYSQLLPAGESFPDEKGKKESAWWAWLKRAVTLKRIEKTVWSLVLLGLIVPLVVLFTGFVVHLRNNVDLFSSFNQLNTEFVRGRFFFSSARLLLREGDKLVDKPELNILPNACQFSDADWRGVISDLPFEDTILLEDSIYTRSRPQSVYFNYNRYAMGDGIDVNLQFKEDPEFREAWVELEPREGKPVNATELWKSGTVSVGFAKCRLGYTWMPGRNSSDGLWQSGIDVRIKNIRTPGYQYPASFDFGKLVVNGTTPVVDSTKVGIRCTGDQACTVPIPISLPFLPFLPAPCLGISLSQKDALNRTIQIRRDPYDYPYFRRQKHAIIVKYSLRWETVVPIGAAICVSVLVLLGSVVALWRAEGVPSDKLKRWLERRRGREGQIALPIEEEAREPLLGP